MTNTQRDFNAFIQNSNFSKIIILTEPSIRNLFPRYFDFLGNEKVIIELLDGEKSKNITTCVEVWEKMLELGVDREALCVNFGGGTVSDIGGFIAATFKRGIKMVNYPTTLLAMIDASVGGKNGINLQQVKNVVGTFYLPEKVFIDTHFLSTLPKKELLSGFGELIKYSLLMESELWTEIQNISSLSFEKIEKKWIEECISFKNKIVEKDLFDKGERNILNFGHTIGHAIESLFMQSNKTISHGYAVALGIIFEIKISVNRGLMLPETAKSIMNFVQKFYTIPHFSIEEATLLATFILNDKKCSHSYIYLPLLKEKGNILHYQQVLKSDIIDILVSKNNHF